ncbi:MAG: MBL fold metallo-hydrolase [Pelolinea sp.]|nr:MBL fold metallo-hydrolase [Pelolinea sp.]
MIRERIADNVYWFQSEVYAQVAAGAIIGHDWAVVVDTLPIPDETLAMRSFIEESLGVQVRYVINTIYHADHTFGNCFFPGAMVIAHSRCRSLMIENNYAALETAQEHNPDFNRVKIVLPTLTFDTGTLTLQVGKRHLRIFPIAGNSPDGIGILVREDRVLLAGDAFLPLPLILEGDVEELAETTRKIGKMSLENIVQGHGDVILRGEIDQAVKSNLNYLSAIQKVAKLAARRKDPMPVLEEATVEQCGKSRVLLGGLVGELHQRNLTALYRREMQAKE